MYPTENIFRIQSETQILDYIKDGQIFGCVEVDLHVPEHLKTYFEELTPIFKHATVRQQDIGHHMKNYLKESKKVFKERRYLIGSMFATKILIITPLLRWYLEHGVKVSKVYQLIEFSPLKCFENFASQISNDRRAGDRNPNLKVIADTSKLIGKST